jgi:hypothetical protein
MKLGIFVPEVLEKILRFHAIRIKPKYLRIFYLQQFLQLLGVENE